MTKYKQYFNQMLEDHQELFDKFTKTHQSYMHDRETWQNSFNRQGKEVQDIIQEYEDRLCAHSEKGQYSKFSDKLAEKFQAEVKKLFPLIDFVGVTISSADAPKPKDTLDSLKKISF